MADEFEIIKGSAGSMDAKQLIHESITHVLSNLYFYKEMLPAERDNEKALIEAVRNDITRIRMAVDDFLMVK